MFDVNRGTLIPRPETELMVERLVKIYNKKGYLYLILEQVPVVF